MFRIVINWRHVIQMTLFHVFIIRISISSDSLILQNMYKSQVAYPAQPLENFTLSQSVANQLDNLSLASRKCSQTQTITGGLFSESNNKTKLLKKSQHWATMSRQQSQLIKKKRQNTMKKLKQQQNKIQQLEREINSLRRKCQNCPRCRPDNFSQVMVLDDFQTIRQQEILRQRFAGGCDQRRNSRQSLQFEAIDFCQSLAFKDGMDDRAWVMLGSMMVIMGSKNMEIDGTINTFKILNDCVDNVRRQVQKSMEKITLDFYFMKEEMKEPNVMEGLDFDPFYTKAQKNGLRLQGLNVECVEQFELVYDEKIKFSVNYESLIATLEHLKSNCWVSL